MKVAEALAREYSLTIEAAPPSKPGIRKGVRYVPEGSNPDLRVRVGGQPGEDVALVSKKAQEACAIGGDKLYIECKNAEAWDFGANFWNKGGRLEFIIRALEQSERGLEKRRGSWIPVAFFSKNHWPILVAFTARGGEIIRMREETPILVASGFIVVTLPAFLKTLDGRSLNEDQKEKGIQCLTD